MAQLKNGAGRRKQSIARAILLYSNAAIVLVVALLAYFWVYREYDRSREMLKSLRAQLFQAQKDSLRGEVEKIADYIRHVRSKTERRIQEDIRGRVTEASGMITHLYERNRRAMPKSRLKAIVLEALRPIRFHGGEGYFFAVSMDGFQLLFADRPEMEGKNVLGTRDTRGKSVVRDLILIAREKGEGFYEYTWTKPGVGGGGFPKIAFVKHVPPFDMFIGSGGYLDTAEKELQREALDWITAIRFGNDGYVFVMAIDSLTFLAHPQKALVGRRSDDFASPYDREIGYRLREASRPPRDGFVTYQWNKPSLKRSVLKISYAKAFPEWNWLIVTGVYMDDVEQMLADKTREFRDSTRRQVLFVALLIVGMVVVNLLYTRFYSRRIQREIDTFTGFSGKAAISHEKIDPQGFSFSEFTTIGEYVNKMVDDFRSSQEEIQAKKDRTQLYLDTAGILFLVLDRGGRVAMINRKGCEIIGAAESGIIGRDWFAFISEKQRPVISRAFQEWITMRPAAPIDRTEYPIVTLDGAERLIAWSTTILRGHGGEATGVLAAGEDVTERRQAENEKRMLESQLFQAQKMEAVGLLAGGIAHDFNNILSTIVGYASLLQLKIRGDRKVEEFAGLILASTERAAALSHSLLAFSRKQEVNLQPAEVNGVISGFHKILARLIGEDIDFRLELAPRDLVTDIDVRQFEQVLMNLATNSRDAMPAGGTLTVSTSLAALDEADGEIPAGSYALVSVSDSGGGMDEKTQSHIFDPFFTTKEVGKGTGLGLAIVYGIVKNHDGFIRVRSGKGQGTTFRIYLPLRPAQATLSARPSQGEGMRGTETILVIEDDPAVRLVMHRILREFGYQVIEAADGVEGLAIFAREQRNVDLILCDLIMPRKNGRETIDEIMRIQPGTKAIFISGYPADILARQDGIDVDIPLLMKPLKPMEMLAMVRRLLDS